MFPGVRLATFLPPDSQTPRAGEVRGDHVVAHPDGVSVTDLLVLESDAPAGSPEWALTEVTLLAPILRPQAIFGIGLNYAAHAAETGAVPPDVPIVFMKLPTSAAAPGAPVHCPAVVKQLDYEGELVVVIGAGGKVGGFAVADDLTARDLQRAESQWTRAKGADGFCPFGPWVTTADEVPDPHNLRLRTWVNEELRQDSSTADLIFKVPELVDFIAEVHDLVPGEIILTGTPSGVGAGMDPPSFLASADTVRIEIEGLGRIEHSIA
jgi:acylpyruvate hydrolase